MYSITHEGKQRIEEYLKDLQELKTITHFIEKEITYD